MVAAVDGAQGVLGRDCLWNRRRGRPGADGWYAGGGHALRLLSNERDRVVGAKIMQIDLCLP